MGPAGCSPGQAPALPGPVAPSGPSGGEVAPCSSSPCLNGAICRPTAASYFCQCPPGFQGPRCAQRENHCLTRPCLNGATCISTEQGRECECDHGFTGEDCEEEVLACGGQYDAPAGFIDFPVGSGTFYDHSISCDYLIRVEPGMVVNLTFIEFRLEGGGGGCNYDWLRILDGGSEHSSPLGTTDGRYCGSRLPGENGTLISTRSSVFMQFRSDHSVSDHGFHLMYNTTTAQCGGLVTGVTRGSLMSPGYPGQYPHNADCTWTIRVDYGKRIQFQFAVLQIEAHPNCSYDSLEIVEGSMSHVIGRYCNSTSPVPAPITR